MADLGGCLHSLSARQQDRKENIPKKEKKKAAPITQPDMKTN